MRCGNRQLFIYYRVPASRLDEALAAVTAMQSELRERHAGLATALLRRPDASQQAEITLMETYAVDAERAPQGIDEALRSLIEARAVAALGPGLAAGRHVEVFDTCAS